MISPHKALSLLREYTPGPFFELIPVEKSAGRFAGEDIISLIDLPPFTNSSMDGYALRSVDTRGATKSRPVKLVKTGEIFAGSEDKAKISKGTCCWVATGAPLPEGADAVIMFEETQEMDDHILVFRKVNRWENVRKKGFELKKGKRIVQKGEYISPAKVGLISACGHSKIIASTMPEIHIIITGEEIRTPGFELSEGTFYDANGPALKSVFALRGFKTNLYRCEDDLERLKKLLQEISSKQEPSIVLISGGASVGKKDFAREALKGAGVKEIFWRVAQRPGKPLLFGVKDNSAYFALPGNPASALVCTFLYALSAVRKMMGGRRIEPVSITGVLNTPAPQLKGRWHFARGLYKVNQQGEVMVTVFKQQASSVLSTFAQANAIVAIPPGSGYLKKGTRVKIFPTDIMGT